MLSLVLAGFLVMLSASQSVAQGKDVVQVATLAELRQQAADNTTIYEVTGEVVLTHQHPWRNQKYLQDATAAVLVDDNGVVITTAYQLYDGITGIKGKLTTFNQLLQFVPVEDPGAATSNNNVVEPLLIALAAITPAHQAQLLRINDVDFVGSYTNFDGNQSYNIEDASGPGVLRTPNPATVLDYFGTPVPTETTDMIVVVTQFNDVLQVFPRALADFYPDGLPTHTVTFVIIDEDNDPVADAVITFDGETFAAGEYVFENVEAGNYTFSVAKEGYFSRSGQVAVTGDDVERTVVLVAQHANAVTTFPWSEGFEATVPPTDWKHFAYGAGGWQSTTTAHTGSGAAYHDRTTTEAGAADSWLVSPQIVIGQDDDLLIRFFERNQFMTNYDYSGVKISIGSGNPEHGEFAEVYKSVATMGTYTERVLGLSAYAGKAIYVAFVYQGLDAHRWLIDDVTIEAAPEAIPVANLAELRQQSPGDLIYEITGEVIITHMHAQRNQKYIQDASAAMLIDDPVVSGNPSIIQTQYQLYDGITGLKGKLTVYNQLVQFVPVEDPGPASSSGNVVEPLKLTLSQLTPDHQAMLVIIEQVSINTESENFAPSISYNISDASGASILRTPSASAALDYFNTPIPTTPVNMIAMVSQFNDDMQIFPRSLADIGVEMNVQTVTAEKPVRIFPNPFSHELQIVATTSLREIVVFNALGQVVESIHNPSERTTLNTSSYQQGIYFVRFVGTNGSVQTEKLIKR